LKEHTTLDRTHVETKGKVLYYGFMKKKFEIAAAGGTDSLAGAVYYCGPDTEKGTSYFQPNPNTRNQGT
jgi:hypothetical protein